MKSLYGVSHQPDIYQPSDISGSFCTSFFGTLSVESIHTNDALKLEAFFTSNVAMSPLGWERVLECPRHVEFVVWHRSQTQNDQSIHRHLRPETPTRDTSCRQCCRTLRPDTFVLLIGINASSNLRDSLT